LRTEVDERSVLAPATLPQVLTNLLDNAAREARSEVRFSLLDDGEDCLFEITDDGVGIAPEIATQLGRPFVSSRQDGLGLGYFLSHASVNEWGGSIHVGSAPGGGTLIRLQLPWHILQPQPVTAATPETSHAHPDH
jgi:two-component system sensor histidine kinase RegB